MSSGEEFSEEAIDGNELIASVVDEVSKRNKSLIAEIKAGTSIVREACDVWEKFMNTPPKPRPTCVVAWTEQEVDVFVDEMVEGVVGLFDQCVKETVDDIAKALSVIDELCDRTEAKIEDARRILAHYSSLKDQVATTFSTPGGHHSGHPSSSTLGGHCSVHGPATAPSPLEITASLHAVSLHADEPTTTCSTTSGNHTGQPIIQSSTTGVTPLITNTPPRPSLLGDRSS